MSGGWRLPSPRVSPDGRLASLSTRYTVHLFEVAGAGLGGSKAEKVRHALAKAGIPARPLSSVSGVPVPTIELRASTPIPPLASSEGLGGPPRHAPRALWWFEPRCDLRKDLNGFVNMR